MRHSARSAAFTRGIWTFAAALLAIEFLDELVFGAREAGWPGIRSDLSLSYAQIGLLLAIPDFFSGVVEPAFGVLGDSRWRNRVVLGGAVAFAAALVLAAASMSFGVLLVAFLLMYPASGAFVSLSQATLIDLSGEQEEQAMARWTLAGSVGAVAGPLVLWLAVFAGIGWRGVFVISAVVMLGLAFRLVLNHRAEAANGAGDEKDIGIREAARGVLAAARRWTTWRWLILLELSDLMLDVLFAFMALYLVDSAGYSFGQASFGIALWAGFGLAGDALLVLLLRRVNGLRWLRFSAVIVGALFLTFLLVPSFPVRMALLALLGLFNAGWYAIPQARLYASLPGQSGAVVSLSAVFGLGAAFVPALLGLIATTWGIEATMWLLLLGPIALLVGLPRGERPIVERVE